MNKTPTKPDYKEEYKRHYEEKKKQGEAFYPFTLYKDASVSLIVFLIILLLAIFVGADLEAEADPNATYNPRPEWYFLFLFELLKLFPGYLEALIAVVIPGVAVAVLLLLPFYDRSPSRHPLRRPIATTLGVVAVVGMTLLTVKGAVAPLVNPVIETDPLIIKGKELYKELRCSACHSISGAGGELAPDLAGVGDRRDEKWLEAFLRNPKAVVPGSRMPNFGLTDNEVAGLTAYMVTLTGPKPPSAEAPQLFAQNCSACHTIAGEGGKIGPDLTQVGTYRDVDYLQRFIENPKAVLPGATMPGFLGPLTREQIEDLARYLAAQKGAAPSPTPAATATPTAPVVATPTATPQATGTPTSPAQATATPVPVAGVSFSKDVQPILKKSCQACHSASFKSGGLDLSTYQALMTTGNHKPNIKPGDAEGSIFYKVLLGPFSGVSAMPIGQKLPADQIQTIKDWIDQGAKDN